MWVGGWVDRLGFARTPNPPPMPPGLFCNGPSCTLERRESLTLMGTGLSSVTCFPFPGRQTATDCCFLFSFTYHPSPSCVYA